MTKKTDLIVNLAFILLFSLITLIPGNLPRIPGVIPGYVASFLIIFILAIAISSGKSLISVIAGTGNTDKTQQSEFVSDRIIHRTALVIKGLSPIRFIIAAIVFFVIEFSMTILLNQAMISFSGATFMIFGIFIFCRGIQWLLLYFILSFKKETASVIGYITAFTSPVVVELITLLLQRIAMDAYDPTTPSILDILVYGGLSTNHILSAILHCLLIFIVPAAIVVESYLGKNKKFFKKS